jgi:phage FluMu gp28-like protein
MSAKLHAQIKSVEEQLSDKFKQLKEAGKLNLRRYQYAFLTDQSRFRIVNKARQIGFSWLIAFEGVSRAITLGRNQLFASASEEQSIIILDYAREHLQLLGIVPIQDSTTKITLPNGAVLRAMPKNYRTIQGFNGDVYLDEFAWNADDYKIWRVIIPSITAIGGRVTILSTPYAKRGKFYELWTNPNNKYSKHEIDIYKALKDGMPTTIEGKKYTFDEFINELKDALDDPDFFPSAYECKFIDDFESYIPLALIEPLMQLTSDEKYKGEMILGIDIGRHKDITSITAISTDIVKQQKFEIELSKTPYQDQIAFINKLISNSNFVSVYIDRTGIGDAIFEGLRLRHGRKVIGVWFNQKIKETLAINVKNHLEKEELLLLKNRNTAIHIASIKRIATPTGFKYDCEKNEKHHADKFWSLALSLYPFSRTRKKMKSKRM